MQFFKTLLAFIKPKPEPTLRLPPLDPSAVGCITKATIPPNQVERYKWLDTRNVDASKITSGLMDATALQPCAAGGFQRRQPDGGSTPVTNDLTEEQKEFLTSDTFKNGYITSDKIAHQSGYRLAHKPNGEVMLQMAIKAHDGVSNYGYQTLWRDIPTVDVDD